MDEYRNALVIDQEGNTIKLYDEGGQLIFSAETRSGQNEPGKYKINWIQRGSRENPIRVVTASGQVREGPSWGVGLIGLAGTPNEIHGGGWGLSNPYADVQGWVGTYGCHRMQNVDVSTLITHLQTYRARTGSYNPVWIR